MLAWKAWGCRGEVNTVTSIKRGSAITERKEAAAASRGEQGGGEVGHKVEDLAAHDYMSGMIEALGPSPRPQRAP